MKWQARHNILAHSQWTSLSVSEAFAGSVFMTEISGKKIRLNILSCLSTNNLSGV